MAAESLAALAVGNLSIDYVTDSVVVHALIDVTFEIAPGEIFGLCGESGSGKSTLAAAVPRLLPPPAVITSGHIHVGGKDVTALSARELRALRGRQIGFVPQSGMNALHPQLTVGEQITNVLRAHGRPSSRDTILATLTTAGLGREVAGAYAHELSGGMRQRAALAIALAPEPGLLIMDEALGALDVVVRHQICNTLVELSQRRGFAILFISHDLPLTLALADRVGVLHEGHLVELGTAVEVRDRPQHAHTRTLLAAFADPLGSHRRVGQGP
ncbi:MAG TPA: ABC transporter ATP-binding protein [Polyangia bacterium]